MKKLLVVYNTFGLNGNPTYYLDCLRALLSQTAMNWGDDYKIAVSGGMLHQGTKDALTTSFGSALSYNFIDQNYPLSVTFNHTVKKAVEHYGPFEGYLYLDSGISFWDPSKHYDAVDKFYNAFKRHDNAVIAGMPSNDDGRQWWGINYDSGADYQFTIGQCTNLHCQIFPEEWRSFYGHILSDYFASNCSESIFSHMAAAIHKKYMMTQDIHVQHLTNLDGASFGSRQPDPDKIPLSGMFETPGLIYKSKRDIDAIYRDGQKFGMGIEEYQVWWRSDKSKFDDKQFATDPQLKEFIKKEFFLSKDLLDYENLKSIWVPGR